VAVVEEREVFAETSGVTCLTCQLVIEGSLVEHVAQVGVGIDAATAATQSLTAGFWTSIWTWMRATYGHRREPRDLEKDIGSLPAEPPERVPTGLSGGDAKVLAQFWQTICQGKRREVALPRCAACL
jgi:hypothetical protein